MEPKVSYALVGAFVIILVGALAGIVLWLGEGDLQKTYDRYHAYMKESVSGLSVNSPVKYRGVEVGRVKEIVLNPDNPEEVRLTLDIVRGTPVKEDTLAVLDTQGLTGLATVNLSGGSKGSPPLQAQPGQEYPVIKSGSSLLFRLDMAISRLLSEQSLTRLLDNLNALTQNATAVIDEDNRAMLRQILKDLSTLVQTLAAQSAQADKGVRSAVQTAENLAALTDAMNKQIPAMLKRIDKSVAALQTTMEEMARAGKTVGSVVRDTRPDLEQFTRQTLAEAGLLVSELRQATATLNRLAQDLEREPNALIVGRPPRPKGPGE